MRSSLYQFNKDQFDGLSKLSFDLAKGAFILALFSTTSEVLLARLIYSTGYIIAGLAFTYIALVILKLKEKALT